MKRREQKLNEWRLLLEEKKQRKLTILEFCREKNIAQSQFYYYQERINKPEKFKADKTRNSTFLKIKPVKVVNGLAKENAVVRFILPNSLQCIVPSDMLPHNIKAILELALSCCK